MDCAEEMIVWARVLLEAGYPSCLLVEYLSREFRLTAREAVLVTLEAQQLGTTTLVA